MLLCLLPWITNGLLGQETLAIVQEETLVTFDIKNFGLRVNGSLGNLEGKIQFDENQLDLCSFEVRVPVGSIDTDNKSRDKHLRSADYFESEKYPWITFKSYAIVKSEESYEVRGNLTIKNFTQDVSIPFTYSNVEGMMEFNGQFTLDRLDYGVGKSSWVLANEVNIKLKVVTK